MRLRYDGGKTSGNSKIKSYIWIKWIRLGYDGGMTSEKRNQPKTPNGW